MNAIFSQHRRWIARILASLFQIYSHTPYRRAAWRIISLIAHRFRSRTRFERDGVGQHPTCALSRLARGSIAQRSGNTSGRTRGGI
jgi:hypothetical protein